MENKLDKRYYLRLILVMLADAASVLVAHGVALLARFDFKPGEIDPMYLDNIVYFLPLAVVTTIVVYYIARLYHSIWRYASVSEVYRILAAYAIIALLLFAEIKIERVNIPRSCLFIGLVLNTVFCVGIRFS